MFDTEVKKAQLMNLRIPCSVLLVDECQDLDECQVDFIDKQKNFGELQRVQSTSFEVKFLSVFCGKTHTLC